MVIDNNSGYILGQAVAASNVTNQITTVCIFLMLMTAAITTAVTIGTIATKFIEACARQPETKSLFTECILFCALAEAFCAVGVGFSIFILLNPPVAQQAEEVITVVIQDKDDS